VNYEKEVSLAKKAYEVFLSFLKEISFEKEMIEQRVRHYENIYHKIEKTVRPRKKNRRTSSAIIRNYVCPYQNCRKRYGSDVSLNLHIKRKHNGGNKSERELFAKEYFEALKNGEELETELNLPPNFIEDIKEEYYRLNEMNFVKPFDPSRIMQYVKDLSEIDSLSDDDDDDGEEGEDGWENEYEGSNSKTYITSPGNEGDDSDGSSDGGVSDEGDSDNEEMNVHTNKKPQVATEKTFGNIKKVEANSNKRMKK